MLDFHKETIDIASSLNKLAEKLEEVEHNSDPSKRVEVLEQELRLVEPEVALTISKGDSLVFKISKVDLKAANQIRAALNLLRSDWLQLKQRAESQRMTSIRMEACQIECQSIIQQLEEYISDATALTEKEKKVCNGDEVENFKDRVSLLSADQFFSLKNRIQQASFCVKKKNTKH